MYICVRTVTISVTPLIDQRAMIITLINTAFGKGVPYTQNERT